MRTLLLTLAILVSTSITYSQGSCKLKTGAWIGQLQLTDTDILPFNIQVEKVGSDYTINIVNAEEVIALKNGVCENDSFHVSFPTFNTELVFKPHGKKKIKGYWINHYKKNYLVPFEAHYTKSENRFEKVESEQKFDYSGKWEVAFEPGTIDEYPAVGIFNQSGDQVTGTFLTETGDYRYLQGNVYGPNILLSCFDGSHAFLFKASSSGKDQLAGQFFSGKHWKSDWKANRNENFELKNPDSLTYLTTEEFSFDLKDLQGNDFHFPNKTFDNKVVIIQIMGTWCPNCMDETRYFKELYEKYHNQGLEIISIGYEIGDTYEQYVERIERFKSKMELDFTFLVGGKANKDLASDHFSMLNEIISYPTSIFIGKDGTVKRVHTGFNGPGTGSYYIDYVEKTNALVESLLKD